MMSSRLIGAEAHIPEERRLAAERSMVDYFIGEIPEHCDKPVAYVLQGNGLWERRKNRLGLFCRQLADIRIPGLPRVLDKAIELSVPRIPSSLLWKAAAFFRAIYRRMGTEAMVSGIYDEKAEAYLLDCPLQAASVASVDFARKPLPPHQVKVLELHSHGSLGAGFSSTDDADEMADRFYGVMGRFDRDIPELELSLRLGGERLPVRLSQLFAMESDPMLSADFPEKWIDRVGQKKTRPEALRAKKRQLRQAVMWQAGLDFGDDDDDDWGDNEEPHDEF